MIEGSEDTEKDGSTIVKEEVSLSLLLSNKNVKQVKEIKTKERNNINERDDLLKNDLIIFYKQYYFF